jgi:hypothetical protein
MIIKTQEFKDICSTILSAIDSNEISTLTETLELKVTDKVLSMSVTNGEYYASVNFELGLDEEFHAAVNANLFLKLIAAVTSENIELSIKDNYVLVKANGTYKIPMISEMIDNSGKVISLPKIEINNPTVDMKISGSVLESILNYNSKELLRGAISRPVQKMFYVDDKGCITFTTGACVNNFTLAKPIKVLFNSRLVKLFKLFKNSMVDFTLGYDAVSEELVQTKVSFKTEKISLTAVTGCNDELLNSVPVNAIRGRAEGSYDNNVVLNKQELLETINRLLLFSAGYGVSKNLKPYSQFVCNADSVTIYDSNKENKETIKFKNDTKVQDEYIMTLDLADLKLILDSISEEYVTLSFGNHQAVVLKRPNISNVIPEVKTV